MNGEQSPTKKVNEDECRTECRVEVVEAEAKRVCEGLCCILEERGVRKRRGGEEVNKGNVEEKVRRFYTTD